MAVRITICKKTYQRYVQKDGPPVERFLMFIENSGHKFEDLLVAVLSILEFFDLDVADCRSQSYDNANNVSGIYSGLQARIHEINDLAEHAPCAVHSMNLVGVHAVECASEAASIFNTVQTLYILFTASTYRWEVLQSHTGKRITLQSLSATRFSARCEAVHVLNKHFDEIIETLIIIEEDFEENAITRQEAKVFVILSEYSIGFESKAEPGSKSRQESESRVVPESKSSAGSKPESSEGPESESSAVLRLES
ncbi:hypothetical protein EVAR_97189_1 [Eumeta japonica]|uniref:Zinc finger MYM-type protein 1 n=1 Tax=Eumeta variegata TaxID=151549 RepID=A0A4C1WFQ0_EUMVA|nr:hypothetical protein EVAR_97189_1 [Eumeta japonica]